MKYKFPVIRHIDDVMHAVDLVYFIVAERGDHTIINYRYASNETFPDVTDEASALRREFRGLIFDSATGKIIRRPWHKFFNVNERIDTQIANINVSDSHIILEKLDGSMIAPYKVGEKLYWGTKMGNTDVALEVYKFIEANPHRQYVKLAETLIAAGYTPIFEWCSRKQRIVLDYGAEDQLILVGIRNMETGLYEKNEVVRTFAYAWNIRCVNVFEDSFSDKFVDKVRSMEDVEGFVIKFDNGHMTKLKCDWYVQLHRVKSDIAYERGVVQLILEEKIDDLKSMMTSEDLEKINEYEAAFLKSFNDSVKTIRNECLKIEGQQLTRKEVALDVVPKLPGYMHGIIFKMYGNNGAYDGTISDLLKDYIITHCNRNNKFDEMRKCPLFDSVPEWNGTEIEDE